MMPDTPTTSLWMANLGSLRAFQRFHNRDAIDRQAMATVAQLKRWYPNATRDDLTCMAFRAGYLGSFGPVPRNRNSSGKDRKPCA